MDMTRATPWFVWIIAIVFIVLVAAGVMYAATTFLFAFSGGQHRMVSVVNYGALIVIVFGAIAAAVTWRIRSGAAATIASLVATTVGWIAAVIAEWLLSFQLGAG